MAGEKHVPLGRFGRGWYDNSIYNGDYVLSATRAAGPDYPLVVSPSDAGPNSLGFGSYHPGTTPFVFCDGSVRSLRSNLSPATLGLLACRNDGRVIPDY
jgi:prepilin-type processing-associated H-X9-DG protein